MTLDDIKSEFNVPERYEVLEENREIFECLLNQGFRIRKEYERMNYHKNLEETHSDYYLGVEHDGDVKRVTFDSATRKIQAAAKKKTMRDVLELKSKESGEGRFVKAERLQDLEPKEATRILAPVLGTIWRRERAISRLKARNEHFKDGLMKLL